MKNKTIFKISFTGIMISLGLVLPFLTGQIPDIGAMLCPMHLPIFICGLICGWKYGAVAGLITPLIRGVFFGMPTLYPTALAMAFELAVYGLISGFLFMILNKKNRNIIISVYISLIAAMILGRVVWGIVRYAISLFEGSNVFNMKIFISGAFITAWPGIILQLILIPSIIYILYKTNILKNTN